MSVKGLIRAVVDWIDLERRDYEFGCAFMTATSEKRSRPWLGGFALFVARDVWAYCKARTICAVKGHELRDGDPGDPEVGPQPDIYCERCNHHG